MMIKSELNDLKYKLRLVTNKKTNAIVKIFLDAKLKSNLTIEELSRNTGFRESEVSGICSFLQRHGFLSKVKTTKQLFYYMNGENTDNCQRVINAVNAILDV